MDCKAGKPLEVLLREAREAAAQYNPVLRNYAGAAEALGVADPNTVGKWERGESVPSNHNMRTMAETYHAPELELLYCSRVCPIGKRCQGDPHTGSIEGLTLKLLHATQGLDDVIKSVIDVTEDGCIDPDEVEQLQHALADLNKLDLAVQSFRVGVRKALSIKQE